MKFKTAVLSLLTAFALTSGLSYASFAQSSKKTTATQQNATAAKKSTAPAADRVMNGSVVAVTAKSIVIKSNGKNSTFLINPETKETGNIAVKKEVTVRYHDENKKHVATSIEDAGRN